MRIFGPEFNMVGHVAEGLGYAVIMIVVFMIVTRRLRSWLAFLCGMLALGASIGGHFHHKHYLLALAAVVLGFLFSGICVVLMYLSVQRQRTLYWEQRVAEEAPAISA